MKKRKFITLIITIVSSIILFTNQVLATEGLDITENSRIKYKWYIEEKVDGVYYPKGEQLDGYYEDEYNIKYGPASSWDYKYCSYSHDKYLISSDAERIYKKVRSIQFVKVVGLKFNNNVRVFDNVKEISYDITSVTDNEVIIDLKRLYEAEQLWFYIDTDKPIDIYLAFESRFIAMSLYKHVTNEKVLIPDKTWIYEKTEYATEYTHQNHPDNDFRKFAGFRGICQAKEIQTYRYKINKVYLDDEYHEFIENYIPDYKDYLVEYTDDLPTKTINITKTVKEIVPIKEYIYLGNSQDSNQDEKESTEVDKSEDASESVLSDEPTDNEEENNKIIETKYIETEVIKKVKVIPKWIYVVITILVLIILIQFVKILKKNVD